MDNGPERIWADIDEAEYRRGSMIGRVFANDIGDIEYVRADIHATALAEAQAHIARLEAALWEARNAAHSLAHDECDGVWSEADFAELTPLADAALAQGKREGV